jgi:hypothetical protein
MDAKKAMERSVDSLQKLYAVVVALAIGQGIMALAIADRASNTFRDWSDLRTRLPGFLAFIVTLVPFFHGMNRHLDRYYLQTAESQPPKTRAGPGVLLFDFFVFFAMSSLLFLVAMSVSEPIRAFMFLGALLVIDVWWGLLAHWIHRPGRKTQEQERGPAAWAAVNVVSLGLATLVVLTQAYSQEAKFWVLLVLAVARTAADYAVCWKVYFPPVDAA